MSDALQYTRASKIRRFGPLASTSGNRNPFRENALGGDHGDGTQPRSPLLPNDIQRSLLHVGMRVRKSVPGGYKTSPDEFDRALRARLHGFQDIPMKPKPDAQTAAKKRSLEEDISENNMPAWQPDLTIQTVLSFSSGARQWGNTKVRSFAIPKSRKAKPAPEPMDIDTAMFVDENGEFKDAEFLEF